MSKHVPPNSPEAERSVLGAMLLSAQAANQSLTLLKPGDFYEPKLAAVFESVQAVTDRGDPIDVVTVAEHLRQTGNLEKYGGHELLADLVQGVPNVSHVENYAKTVVDYAARRRLIEAGRHIVEMGADLEQETPEVHNRAEKMIMSTNLLTAGSGLQPASDVIDEAITALEKTSDADSLPSGLIDLDRMLLGFRGGQFVVVAARPSMGKSAFVQTVAMNAASDGRTVAMFNLEMSNNEVMTRLLSMVGRVNANRLRSRTVRASGDEHLWDRIITAAQQIHQWPLFLDDAPEPTTTEIRAKCRRLRQEKGQLDLVIVDYMQLMPSDSVHARRHDNRQQEIADISRQLKALAREMEVPVIGVSQLNRAVETRRDKRPMLSDLRESGAIEQDADIVLFLYRDEYYNEDSADANTAEVSVGKNRNGSTGKIRVLFQKEHTLFLSYAAD